MRAYTFDFLNHDGSIDSLDIGEFEDDRAAAEKGRSALMASLSAVAVEVWGDGARVARISRGNVPQRPIPAPRPFATALDSVQPRA